jgi:hypothetical protein
MTGIISNNCCSDARTRRQSFLKNILTMFQSKTKLFQEKSESNTITHSCRRRTCKSCNNSCLVVGVSPSLSEGVEGHQDFNT